jgi:hypothetical protein
VLPTPAPTLHSGVASASAALGTAIVDKAELVSTSTRPERSFLELFMNIPPIVALQHCGAMRDS